MESCDMSGAFELSNTLKELFTFDPHTFSLILTGLLVSFAVGHASGVVNRIMRKT